jgi:hypothetical protein
MLSTNIYIDEMNRNEINATRFLRDDGNSQIMWMYFVSVAGENFI